MKIALKYRVVDALSGLMGKHYTGAEIKIESIGESLLPMRVEGRLCVLYLVLEGSGRLVLKDGDAVRFHQGDAMIVFGKTGHTISPDNGGGTGSSDQTPCTPVRLLSMNIHLSFQDQKIFGLPDMIHVPQFKNMKMYADLLEKQWQENAQAGRPGASFCNDCMAGMVLTEIIQEHFKDVPLEEIKQQSALFDSQIGCLLTEMTEHCGEEWDLARLVAMTPLSRATLFRRFSSKVGMSPKKYLIACRMQRACRTLANRDVSVKEIARQVGYQTVFAFSKAFRAWMKMSPSQYRQRMVGTRSGD